MDPPPTYPFPFSIPSHDDHPSSPKFQTPHSSPSCRTSLSPNHAPIKPPIINLDPEHIDLNVPIVNLLEGKVKTEKVVEDVAKRDEFAEEVQSDEVAPAKKEVEFCDVLHNVIAESMNATFKEVLLENVALKEQIAILNT
ncbi:hypothetical protein E5676_scaffold9G00190 [Cucumis melo var. makuwa]|uniref:Uncharacterized protein n=1 Tax=Cucumis melo var. makuwa TaxID=1194695 RepID=A0A5D3D7U0_CUCMM|nr:hypothetical protein E6C27_scaffold845G00550 [Cucumis melo var. makuwa]TYK19614.1 hypothetical protein E5676_scaffold9G00190 [Cucumis melo var. makuwa]